MKKFISFLISSLVFFSSGGFFENSILADELKEKVDSLFIRACGGLEKYRELAEPAKEALIEMGEEAVPYLLDKLDTQSAREKWTLINILSKIGEPAVMPLIGFLKSDNKDEVKLASRILGDIKDKRAVSPLIELLDKDDFNTRSYACESLGKIGDTTAFIHVSFCLKDSVEVVRKSAAIALGRMKDIRAIPYLIYGLSDPHFSVRMSSASSMVEIGEPSLKPLFELLSLSTDPMDPADTVAVYLAIESLGKLKDKRAIKPLLKKLEDDDWATRAFVVEALGEIGDKKGIKAIKNLQKKEKHPFVLKKIEEVLGKIER
ncbi:MAG: HEAT repeat domain-containing protein [Candidatus Zixiibacteriota bacterium]